MIAELTSRREDGDELDVLVWRFRRPMLVASTALVGGGLGPRDWVINAQVINDYRRIDVDVHVAEMAQALGLDGVGVGMLTAASVRRHECSSDEGVYVDVTVGLSHPTWAASDERLASDEVVAGTINVVVFVPVRLDDGAMLNAIATATEAKSQALWEAAIPATGTPSDAVTILCPLEGASTRFAGPRSSWGARLARAVHGSVLAGATRASS
jgi:adenosylcobinamide amidohydrolase